MKPLPDAQTLATLVSNVTSTMLGISFAPVDTPPSTAGEWRTALLPIPGARPVVIGLASETESARRLSAAMFSCPGEEVDESMRDDSLRELANMTAGLVKNALGLDALLGLPVIKKGAEVPERKPIESVFVRAESLGLLLWVTEGALP
ncbi:MAG: chemotaxis protein CheX [Archangium sp.]